MLRKFLIANPGLLWVILFISCNQAPKPVANGKDLAEHYCGTCHRYPDPSLLDSETGWCALSAMAPKVGLKYFSARLTRM
jgi:hypothetical protein